MGIFGRLDRLAGRFNRWFGPTAVATDVAGPGPLTPGVGVVAEEVEREMEGSAPIDPPGEEGAEESG